NIVARAFYALGDTKTPMQISLVCLATNFIIAGALLIPLRQGGPGIANTFTSCLNAGLLLFALRKKLGKLGLQSLRDELLWLLPLGMAAGLIAWFGWHFWQSRFGHATVALTFG